MAVVKSGTAVMGRKGAFSSDDLPAHLSEDERFDLCFHAARPAFVPACEMVQAEGRPVGANFEFACFGDAASIRFRANVSREVRAARHVATDQRDAYHLVFNTNEAPLGFSQLGREAVLETGHALLASMAEPLDIHCPTGMSTVCLSIPGARLRERIADPDDLLLRTLDPANTALCHLRRYMKCLFDANEFEGDPVLSARIEATLIDLAAMTLGAKAGPAALAYNGLEASREVGTLPGAEWHGVRYRFAGFELEPCERRLTMRGEPVTLTPKVFDTLVLLVERAGRVVSKDELMAALWPRGFVSDSNLVKHIWAIRKTLNDGAGEGDSRFIETVSKLGYRFVAPVERIEACDPVSTNGDGESPVAGDAEPHAHQFVALPETAGGVSAEPRTFGRRESDRVNALAVADKGAARKRRRLAVAAAIVVLVFGGIAGAILWQRKPSPAGKLPPGTAVAIVGFNNLSHNPKDVWLGAALTEMLGTEVTAADTLHVLPDELVRPARKDLPAPLAGGYASASLTALRKRLRADYVISGSYLVSGAGTDARVRVDLVLQDARNDARVATFSRTRPVTAVASLASEAGAALRVNLGFKPLPQAVSAQVTSAMPPNTDVMRHMGFALDALRTEDAARARDELLLAVAQAPAYAPAYALLSRAWSALGYKDKARAAIEQALAHAAGLPEAQRLQIEAQQHVLAYEPDAAAKTYKRLAALRPDDPEPRRQLINALMGTDKTAEIKQALQAWHDLPGAATDPRWELAASAFDQKHGDFMASIQHARRALDLAKARDAAGLIAESERQYGTVLGQGPSADRAQALSMLRASIKDYRAIGNPLHEAAGYEMLGALTGNQPQVSREALQRAMAIYQQVGNLDGQARVYSKQSRALWQEGDADGAATALRQAIRLHHTVGDLQNEIWSTVGLVKIEGDTSAGDSVVALYVKLLGMESRQGDHRILAYTRSSYGNLLRERGQLAEARAACAAAVKEGDIKGFPEYLDTIRLVCVGVTRDSGDVAAARSLLEHVVRTQGSAMNTPLVALASVVPLAALDMQSRDWSAARDLLKPWAELGVTPDQQSARTTVEAQANALIALCYQALGETAARDQAVARARELRNRITENRTRFVVDLALARLQGETGHRQEAVAALKALATDADKRHWMASALEARLAAYRLPAQADDLSAAALHDKIAATAKSHGFKWVLARLDKPAGAAVSAAPLH